MSNTDIKRRSFRDALVHICVAETERVVKQARENEQWETCFGVQIDALLATHSEVKHIEFE